MLAERLLGGPALRRDDLAKRVQRIDPAAKRNQLTVRQSGVRNGALRRRTLAQRRSITASLRS